MPEPDGRPIDLDDVVLEEVRSLRPAGINVDTSEVSAAQVVGHGDQLRRVVSNLLDNAARHANGAVALSA